MCVGPAPVAARTRVGGRVGDPTVAGRVADRLRDCISATRASRSAAAASTRARKDLAAFPPERLARKPSVAKYSSGADDCGNIDAGAVAGRAGHASFVETGRRREVRGRSKRSTGNGAVKKAPSPYEGISSDNEGGSAGGGGAAFATTGAASTASLFTISPKLPSTSLKPWRS